VAANEQGPVDSSGAPFDENEDLFDFPVIEMTLEGLQERTPGSGDRQRPAPPQPAPAAPLPAKATPPPPPAMGSVPPPPTVHEPSFAPAKSAAPKPAAPKPDSPKPEMPKPDRVAPPPAQVPIASIMTAPVAPPAVEEPPPPPRRQRVRGMRIALILLLGLNAIGFWFLWRTHSTFGAGLDGLRAELDDAALRLERARRDVERGVGMAPIGVGLEAVDALERTAIDLAINEIRNGEYGAARKRLSRLLVRAERMSPGLRAEIEPRAAYLIATSYHDEARARNGEKR